MPARRLVTGAVSCGLLLCIRAVAAAQTGTPAAPVGTPSSGAHVRIEAKLNGLQERIDNWLAAGGDPREVMPLGQQLDALMDAGTPEDIEAQIDRIRAVIATPPPTPVGVTGSAPVRVQPIPTNAAIIFHSVRSGVGPEVYTMTSEGTEVTQITFFNPRPYDQPYEHVAASFDHKMIAVDRYLKGGAGPTGVWIIDLEHGTEMRLVPKFFSAGNGGVDWSADGYIYFAGRPTAQQKEGIFRIRPDGSQLTQVIALASSDPGFVGDVSVSEDSSLLAYVRAVGVKSTSRTLLKTQIWVARVDGGEQRMVDDGGPELGNQGGFPIGDFDPETSPDNQSVVFSRTNTQHISFKSTMNTGQDLWVAPLDRSASARRLTLPGPISIVPDWHGGRIVFTEFNEQDGGYAGLVLINADGTGYRRLEGKIPNLRDGGRQGKWIPGAPVVNSSR